MAIEPTGINSYSLLPGQPEVDGWCYYVAVGESSLPDPAAPKACEGGKRLIKLDRLVDAADFFTLVLADVRPRRTWGWSLMQSYSEVQATLAAKNAFAADLNPTAGAFDLVWAEKLTGDPRRSFIVDQTFEDVTSAAAQSGSYVSSLDSYALDTGTRYVAMLTETATSEVRRLDLLTRERLVAVLAADLEEVSGTTLTRSRVDLSFTPGPAIFSLLGVHALREVSAGRARLTDPIPIEMVDTSSGCATGSSTQTEPLETALGAMLGQGATSRAKSILDHFGVSPIQATARSLGMAATRLDDNLGCTTSTAVTDLADLAVLHRAIALGTAGLDGASSAQLRSFEAGGAADPAGLMTRLSAMVDGEAARAGWQSVTSTAAFKAQLSVSYEAGSWLPPSSTTPEGSIAGVVSIPRCSGGAVTQRNYVFGTALLRSVAGAFYSTRAFTHLEAEPLRPAIREAIKVGHDCF
jgi:hypothetical protein